MKLLIKYTLIHILISATPTAGKIIAQSFSYNWINYTTKQGLPSNHVFYCYQDKKGFIWFGTKLGVSKFDGTKFVNYNERNGLSDIEISKIQEDDFGNLWVGSLWGNIYQFQKDSFIPFAYNQLIQSYKDKFRVVNGFDIQTNMKDSVISFYIGLEFYGVLKINSKGQKVEFTSKHQRSIILYQSKKNSFATVHLSFTDGRWLNEQLREPCPILKIYDDKLELLFEKYLPNGSNGFYANYIDNHFIGSFGYLYNFGINKSYVVSNVKNCLELIVCKDGKVLLGENDSGGLLEYSNIQKIKQEKPIMLLENVSVSKILIDNQEGYWVTTTDDGVFYLSNKNLGRLKLIDVKGGSEGFEKIRVSGNGSAIWFLSKNAELINWNFRLKKIKLLKLSKQTVKDILPLHNSTSVYITGTKNTSFIDNGKILNVIDKIDNFKLVSKKLIFSEISNSVFGFNHWGLFELRRDTLLFRLNYSFDNRMSDQQYLSIYIDPFDSLWIVRRDGIWQFDVATRALKNVPTRFNEYEISGLLRLSKYCFLYTTTNNGIIFKDEDTTFIVNRESGLQSNTILEVKSNDIDKIYILTSAGLDQIEYKINSKIQIKSIKKIRDIAELNINDFDIDSNGIWLATSDGIYFKQNEVIEDYIPIPFLEEMVVEGRKSVFELHDIQNPVLIRWNCINYSLIGRINYRYRMDSTEEWIYTKTNQLFLNNFKAKEYQIEVQAQNADGIWSSSLIHPIQILKPWYNSNVFYLIIALIIVSSIIQYFNIENRRLRKEVSLNLELAEMERKLFSIQMNPHFLFNCLTSIQLLIRQNDLENASNYLSKFASITRSVLNFVKNTIIPINDEVQFLNQYLALEKLRFKDNFVFNIRVDPTLEKLDVVIPSLLVQPFVENSIKYGLKSKDHILNISIDFEVVPNNCLLITIMDNGPGINLENRSKSQGEYNKIDSVGINLSRQRINRHNKKVNINGLSIQSILNEENIVIGTKVEILLLIV